MGLERFGRWWFVGSGHWGMMGCYVLLGHASVRINLRRGCYTMKEEGCVGWMFYV